MGALMGTTPVTAFIERAMGVSGGRLLSRAFDKRCREFQKSEQLELHH